MKRFVPQEKMSKKQKKALAAKQRGSWHGVRPVTRIQPNQRAYNRKKLPKFWD